MSAPGHRRTKAATTGHLCCPPPSLEQGGCLPPHPRPPTRRPPSSGQARRHPPSPWHAKPDTGPRQLRRPLPHQAWSRLRLPTTAQSLPGAGVGRHPAASEYGPTGQSLPRQPRGTTCLHRARRRQRELSASWANARNEMPNSWKTWDGRRSYAITDRAATSPTSPMSGTRPCPSSNSTGTEGSPSACPQNPGPRRDSKPPWPEERTPLATRPRVSCARSSLI